MPNLPPPAPTSEIPGNFIASALWNASLYNSILFLASPPIAQYAQTSVQAMASSTVVTMTWPTPVYDSYGGYAAGNPTRYTPQVAGWYLVVANLGIAPNGTGFRMCHVLKNGSTTASETSLSAATAGFNSVMGVTALVNCNGTTDYFEVQGDQSSGAPLNTITGLTNMTVLWVHA